MPDLLDRPDGHRHERNTRMTAAFRAAHRKRRAMEEIEQNQ